MKDDCILLTYMCGDKILYVSKSGEIHIFDLQIPKIMTHKTNFQNVTCAAISRDGRFLALADCDNDSFVSKYELRVIDMQMLKVLLYVNGNHLFGGLQYLTFVQHKNTFPRLLASDVWRILDWKITDTFQKYDTDSQRRNVGHSFKTFDRSGKSKRRKRQYFCDTSGMRQSNGSVVDRKERKDSEEADDDRKIFKRTGN